MKISADSRELVKAVVLGETARADELNAGLGNDVRKGFRVFVSAFFNVMLEEQFKDDSSRDAILDFVNEMRDDFHAAEPPIKPLVIEGLIRASSGEEHFFDEITREDSYRAEFQVITKIAHQAPQVKERLDKYLSDAENLAAQWGDEAS